MCLVAYSPTTLCEDLRFCLNIPRNENFHPFLSSAIESLQATRRISLRWLPLLPKERSVEQIYFELSGGAVAENLSDNAGDARDTGSIPGYGRSPGVECGKPLQHSCLENSVDRGAWRLQTMGLQRVGHDWATENTSSKKLRWVTDPSYLTSVCPRVPLHRGAGCSHTAVWTAQVDGGWNINHQGVCCNLGLHFLSTPTFSKFSKTLCEQLGQSVTLGHAFPLT